MAKHKKKRTKQYRGADAAANKPVVTKLEAADRNKPAQWWFEHKQQVKPVAKVAAVVAFIALIIYELFRPIL